MKKTTIISTLFASALALTPTIAQDKPAEVPAVQPAQENNDKMCLDAEIRNLETALDQIGKALEQRMSEKEQQLAKAKSESEDLRKRLAAAETKNKNMSTEFQAFKASTEKQRQATMANFAKVQQSSQESTKAIAQLKQQNAQTEANCKAACERLKKIVGNLQKVEADLSKAQK